MAVAKLADENERKVWRARGLKAEIMKSKKRENIRKNEYRKPERNQYERVVQTGLNGQKYIKRIKGRGEGGRRI